MTPADLRAAARARAEQLGLPGSALEDWRYVRCAPLARPPAGPAAGATDAALQALLPDGPALLLVDGRVQACLGTWPATWRLGLGDEAWLAGLHDRLATEDDTSACWALAEAGCVQRLQVERDAGIPLTVLSCATGGRCGWQLSLDLAPGVHLGLRLLHLQTAPSRCASLLDCRLSEGSALAVDELQLGAATEIHAHARIRLEREAQLAWCAVGAGGDLVRHRTLVELAGEGAEADLAAIDVCDAARQAHRLTRVLHACPRTRSRQLFKTSLRGTALASFDGLVSVLPGADGTEAEQQSRNLLLSPTSRADTRPQLDVRADEVKASHGATVGRLDEEELTYLRLRGLPRPEAEALLERGWVGEVVVLMADPWMQDHAVAESRSRGVMKPESSIWRSTTVIPIRQHHPDHPSALDSDSATPRLRDSATWGTP